jgi:predicted phosphodiesterase
VLIIPLNKTNITFTDIYMQNVLLTKSLSLYLRPTKRRDGTTKAANDKIELMWIDSNLFEEPCLITSDLHSHSREVFDELVSVQGIDLKSLNVITLGDMAGDYVYGSDGDPTELYEYLHSNCKSFYFVQGNHDLPPTDIDRLESMMNDDGTPCFVPEGEIIKTPFGNMAGVHGSFSLKRKKAYVRGKFSYCKQLLSVRKCDSFDEGVDILLTHDCPEKKDIMECVKKIRPKIHLFGHYHLDDYHFQDVENEIDFFNADARVFLINCTE